ncbi:hypothetical protein KY328_03835, partial [Candidatus Woesearchaeota archaeon]|nr:hypothetical protein [Candidatus Woesearchaeota archaeon]
MGYEDLIGKKGQYELLEKLGRGKYFVVFKVRGDGKFYAAKVVDPKLKESNFDKAYALQNKLGEEADRLLQLDHDHILKVHDIAGS